MYDTARKNPAYLGSSCVVNGCNPVPPALQIARPLESLKTMRMD
jgi:hypothetical protein